VFSVKIIIGVKKSITLKYNPNGVTISDQGVLTPEFKPHKVPEQISMSKTKQNHSLPTPNTQME